MSLKFTQRAIAFALTGAGLLVADAAFSPVHAAQQLSCTGRMSNGWNYNAEFLNGRFTQIRWTMSGKPPQVSPLTFSSTNSQGQPIYRGSLLAAVAVTLVDLGKGNVRPGSEISVGVEEWGWSRGKCGTSSAASGTGASVPLATVPQNTTQSVAMTRVSTLGSEVVEVR
jgi:hypothetical protein